VKGGRGGGGKGQEALTSACVQEELLMRASREGKTSLVEKLVACGAKPGETDEVREDEQGKRGGGSVGDVSRWLGERPETEEAKPGGGRRQRRWLGERPETEEAKPGGGRRRETCMGTSVRT
jgi:hypothetical protein